MARSYDLKLVVCTIGGVEISGYGESDAITPDWAAPITEETVCADGDVIFNRINDKRLKVTLTLMATSRALNLLVGLIETQHGDISGTPRPVLIPLPFLLTDPATGMSYSGEAVFTDRPAMPFGKTVGEVEIMFTVPKASYTPPVKNLL